LPSEEIFGYWKLELEDKPFKILWHYLKDQIQSSWGVIKMVCPQKKAQKEKAMLQFFTSKANMLVTGLTLIHIMEKDIEYEELESGCITKVIRK